MTNYEAGDPTILWVVGIWLAFSLVLAALFTAPEGRAFLARFKTLWEFARAAAIILFVWCLIDYWGSIGEADRRHEAAMREELCRLGSDLCGP